MVTFLAIIGGIVAIAVIVGLFFWLASSIDWSK